MNIYQMLFSNLEYVYCSIFGSVLIIVPYACIFLNQVAGNHVHWSPDEQQFSDSNKKSLVMCTHYCEQSLFSSLTFLFSSKYHLSIKYPILR